MVLTSIKTRIFLAVAVLQIIVAGLVMTASRQAVDDAVVQTEERAVANTVALIEANIQGRYRTLLKNKVQTVQTSKQALREFDQVVTATLDQFAAAADRGQFSEVEARKLALTWLSTVKPVTGDYIFAFGPDNRALVYPNADLLKADLSGFTDVKGRSVVEAARDEVTRYGSTYLTYQWKALGDANLVPKYGHFIAYRRWGWIIGSVGDVNAVREEVNQQREQLVGELRDTLPHIRMGGGGFVFVFDRERAFVVPPADGQREVVRDDILRRLAASAHEPTDGKAPAALIFAAPDGTSMEGRVRYIKALDWYVATVLSRDAMLAPAESLLAREAMVFAGALALGLLLAYVFADRVSRPLTHLAGYAKALSTADFTAAEPFAEENRKGLPVRRRDEVGRLAEAFIFMTDSLQANVRSLMAATSARERIEGELNVARDIQLGLLPKVMPAFPDRPEVDLSSLLVSAKEVGGDLFDYYFLDQHHLCFTIGDVAGKGVPAALFMAITKTLIKAAAERNAEPAAMLDRINNDLSHDNPNVIFVTLVVGILDVRDGRVRYANAGHNPPAILRLDGSLDILRGASGPAAGVMDDIHYAPLETYLAPGESILLYTDGVTEAETKEGAFYGDSRLFDLLRGTGCSATPDTIVRRIMADVREHAGGATQSDDITILSLRYMGPSAPPSRQN